MVKHSKQTLRRRLREKRRNVTVAHLKEASDFVVKTLLQWPEFIQSQTIALYCSQENEIDLFPLIQLSLKMQKAIYLPVLNKVQHQWTMEFHAYKKDDVLRLNQFNILEPAIFSPKTKIHPSKLDLVLVPLVGFDKVGYRLGRGGGYYDRAFNFCMGASIQNAPLLVGVAYEFQRIDAIKAEKHDITLDRVVTERNIHYFTAQKKGRY
jgi:5-formyltetrahydrofolate cyclo-ligase